MSSPLSRDAAWSLLSEWVQSESLRRHCLAVEASMVAYAEAAQPPVDVEAWAVAGLLHDADYERHPDMEADDGHPRTILAELRNREADPEIIAAIAGHADFMGVARETPMARTLYAVDELSGFVVACAQVRPEGLSGMTPKSVKKKLKTPAFAAAVNREDVRRGAEELGVDLDAHIATVIAALDACAGTLGLQGSGATEAR